jgi:hypothetical protein
MFETEFHTEASQEVLVMRRYVEASYKLNELPITVTEYDPEAGTFARMLTDIKGALNVKTSEELDDRIAAVTATKERSECPRAFLHITLESEIQPDCWNDVRVRRVLIVVANAPKFEPVMVTLALEVMGRFVIATELMYGVVYVNAFNKDPIWEATVKRNDLVLPNPADKETPEDESDVHRK